MIAFLRRTRRWLQQNDAESGQGLVEYGLILSLVAVLCVASLGLVQSGIDNTLGLIANSLP